MAPAPKRQPPLIGTSSRSLVRSARKVGLDGAAVVMLGGLVATAFAYFWMRNADEEREQVAFRRHAHHLSGGLQKRLDRSFELVQTVPALLSVKPDLTPAEFSKFIKLVGSFHAEVQWAPRIEEAQRAEVEAGAQNIGLRDYQIREAKGSGLLVRASTRAAYLPILYSEPPNDEILGFDLQSEPKRRSYVEQSRDTGRAVVSERFDLIEEQLPTSAIALYQPVYIQGQPIGSEQQRRSAFRGVVASVLLPEELIKSGLADADAENIDVALIDESAAEDNRLLYESSLGAGVWVDASSISATFPLHLSDRRWQVGFAPGLGFARLTPQYRFHIALAGFGLSLLLAMVYAVLRSRRVLRQASKAMEQLGQYEILEEIGRGGMGVVFKARHSTLRRATAVKLLSHPSDQLKQRFEREARVTSRLRHPNTVAIYDYGRTPDGSLYYAMEYISGISLAALVKQAGPQPASRVIHILRQVAGSLAEAHAEGLVHRDIKPSNIMLQSKGGVPDFATVLDFGLVRDLSVGKTITDRQLPVGTPAYMAPEQIRDEAVSESSDLYALGGLAYFLLTSTPPFRADTAAEVCVGHVKLPVQPLNERLGEIFPEENYSVPTELAELVLELLQKQPEQRPASALALLARLEELAERYKWSREEARAWWSDEAAGAHSVRVSDESLDSSGRKTISVDFSWR